MAAITKYFTPDFNVGGDTQPYRRHPNIPYSGLTSIEVHSITCCKPKVASLVQSMICYQSALTSVTFCCQKLPTPPSVSLLSTLGSLFLQPQFRKVRLTQITINWDHLSAVLPQFLSATSENHEKVLEFNEARFDVCGTRAKPVDINTRTSGKPQKALIVDHCSELPPNFFKWLSAYSYTRVLSSLTLGGQLRPPKSLCYVQCSEILTAPLQHIQLYDISLRYQGRNKLFISLFESSHLKTFRIDVCDIGLDGLLPAFTRGLQRQLSVGSLEVLSLDANFLGDSADSDLQEFFDVLFSLPQLSNLQLSIRDNLFRPKHFFLMHDSWKRNAGDSRNRLSVLSVSRWESSECTNFIDNIPELQEIAQNLN